MITEKVSICLIEPLTLFKATKKIANISKNILFFPDLILNIMNLVNETGNDSKKMYKMNKKYEGTFQQVFHS